jgi:hypothetical protein
MACSSKDGEKDGEKDVDTMSIHPRYPIKSRTRGTRGACCSR